MIEVARVLHVLTSCGRRDILRGKRLMLCCWGWQPTFRRPACWIQKSKDPCWETYCGPLCSRRRVHTVHTAYQNRVCSSWGLTYSKSQFILWTSSCCNLSVTLRLMICFFEEERPGCRYVRLRNRSTKMATASRTDDDVHPQRLFIQFQNIIQQLGPNRQNIALSRYLLRVETD